jgi:hypothetical protein
MSPKNPVTLAELVPVFKRVANATLAPIASACVPAYVGKKRVNSTNSLFVARTSVRPNLCEEVRAA